MNIIVRPSSKPDKKYTTVIDNKKPIDFGQKGASNYTKHKNKERKERYLQRRKDDYYNNYLYPSFYSTNLLWNKPTITESMKDTNKRFKNISIKMR